jgi:hypothetical protein
VTAVAGTRTAAVLALAVVAAFAAAAAAPGRPGDAETRSDEEAIRATIERYFEGHRTGHGDAAASAFHPIARLAWIREGALTTRSLEEYLAGFSGRPADDEDRRRRRVVNVDVAGDAAVARLELDYPDATITDFMTLLEVDGEWKIVHKSFHVQPKEAS